MKSSATAGALAALAGMFGKLGADGDSMLLQVADAQCASFLTQREIGGIDCSMLLAVLRVASLALMLATNAAMLGFFVQGLHETDSLTATVTSAAVNFMLSAAGGRVLFGEHLPAQWFLGATLILVGMGCLLHGDAEDDDTKKKKEKQS
ncbi:hypothetical protein PINS_up010401 [Pythium insidiosum]|nr:hypothetical protein PINS_up010401 [Pythium insidiosum]